VCLLQFGARNFEKRQIFAHFIWECCLLFMVLFYLSRSAELKKLCSLQCRHFMFRFAIMQSSVIIPASDANFLASYMPFLRAIAECFARLSHGLSVRPSVTPWHCIETVQAKITKSSAWAASRSLVFRDKISCPWVRGFPSNEDVKQGCPSKNVIFALLALLVWKRLR